jgi:heme-degrading monooxygenase HmoA
MYVVIRKTGLVGFLEKVAERARDHIVPLIQGRAGFRGYCVFVTEQGDVAYSVSIFEDREAAMDADQRVQQWIGANMSDLMPDAPEVVAGETVFHNVSHPQEQQKDGQGSLFVIIRSYTGLTGQTETMHSLVSEHTLPAIKHAKGFRGFYAFRDEADPNRAISVTLFDDREEAMQTHEAVVAIMRDQLGSMAYGTPEVVVGETVVLATE